MSIKSGQCYKITNEHTKLVIDLSRADSDHKSIIGWIFHGGENQKWITEKQVNGQWTIRSVCASAQKYLGVEKTLDNGTLLVGRDEPQFWDIEILPGCEDSTRLRVKFCQWVCGTCFVADYTLKEPYLGVYLQVWRDCGVKNQIWVLEELDPSHHSMSINSGQCYKITNEHTKLVVDLHGANNKSIIGHDFHGGENQQWIIEEQVNGQWTIRSVRGQKYLGVERFPENGTHLVGLDRPQFWDIEILPGCKDPIRPSVKLCQWVRGACFVVDYPLENPALGANLQLWSALGGNNQIWVLEERSSWFPLRSMYIKSGRRYRITNEQTKLVIDLSHTDNESIIGNDFHGRQSQQWITEKQVNGKWTIQSVRCQKYLGIETTPVNGTHLIGINRPQFWDIEMVSDCKVPTKPSVRFCQWVRGACFVADCPVLGNGAATDLQLCTARGGKNQVWVLEEYS